MTVKATIIIPCYNTGDNIGKTLRAFSAQATPAEDFEIIVIDDRSTDNTVEEIKKELGSGQIQFIQNETNSGPALTRNKGLDLAQGEIIIFSDGDTVPCPTYLQDHLQCHRDYPEENCVVIGAAAMPEDIEITPLMYLGNVVQTMSSAVHVDTDPYNWLHFSTLNVSLKRHFLGSMRFNQGQFKRQSETETELAGFEDTELAQRLAKKGMKVVHAPSLRAYHYHFRSPEDYINKVFNYGRRYALWLSMCDPSEREELNRRMNYLLDRKNPLSVSNIKECLRRILVNDLTYPLIQGAGKLFESRNERISLFLYQKLYKYLFLKGYHSQ